MIFPLTGRRRSQRMQPYWCHLDWPIYCMGQAPKGSPGSSFNYKQVWDDLKLNYLQIITYTFPKLRFVSKVLEFWYIYLKQGLLFSVLNFKYARIWTFEWSLLRYTTLKLALEWWYKVVLKPGVSVGKTLAMMRTWVWEGNALPLAQPEGLQVPQSVSVSSYPHLEETVYLLMHFVTTRGKKRTSLTVKEMWLSRDQLSRTTEVREEKLSRLKK